MWGEAFIRGLPGLLRLCQVLVYDSNPQRHHHNDIITVYDSGSAVWTAASAARWVIITTTWVWWYALTLGLVSSAGCSGWTKLTKTAKTARFVLCHNCISEVSRDGWLAVSHQVQPVLPSSGAAGSGSANGVVALDDPSMSQPGQSSWARHYVQLLCSLCAPVCAY